MATPSNLGIKITAGFERNGASDTYALIDILTVKGGFASYIDMAEVNNSIPAGVRRDNMVVYTQDTRSFYELTNNPSTDVTVPQDWTLLTTGGGVNLIGTTWNATTNSPSLDDNVGTAGDFYICATAGTVNDVNIAAANGITFIVGDWIIYDGSNWRRLAQSGNAGDWNTLANKPATFPPGTHTHTISDVTNLQTNLNAKEELTNKIQNLADLVANKTSTSLYPSLNAIVDYIAQEIAAAGSGGGGSTDHNLLTTLQGGQTNEYYHFTADQHSDLLALIYTAPTIRFNGTTALRMGVIKEVGDSFTESEPITATFTETQNLTPANSWEKKETQAGSFGVTNISSNTFTSAYNGTPTTQGIHKVSEGRVYEVTSSGAGNVLVSPTVYTYVQTMYRVYYFIYDSSVDFTDPGNAAALQSHLNAIKGTTNVANQQYHQLRASKFTGNVTFTEPGSGDVYMYMVAPDSYGTPGFAPQAFPSSPIATTDVPFTYVNGSTNINYKVTRINSVLNTSGSIDLIIT